jgi:hypothetical protein
MNLQESHQYFSVSCFNETWSLLDLPDRTTKQEQQMISLAQASLYHWTCREDCAATNLSVGLWLLARVYSVLDSPKEALRYASECLELSSSNNLDSFYMAYAHEAMARAADCSDDSNLAQQHKSEAERFATLVEDELSKQMVRDDLETVLV